MTEDPQDDIADAAAQTDRRRRYDTAAVFPIFAALLFLPPIITIFLGSGRIFGMPAIVVYIFGIWIALIVFARVLSGMLRQPDPDRDGR